MTKRTVLNAVLGLSLAISGPSALAQKVESEPLTAEDADALAGLFGDLFDPAEPLTPEQEARLPEAMQVIAQIMPEGTLARMMDETMGPMMQGMMSDMIGSPAIMLAQLTGLSPVQLGELDDVSLAEALALLDPDAEARNIAMGEVTFGIVSEVMAEVEPSYRAGLARAYAVRFSKEELLDLNAYFSTPVGSKYAAESYLIFADPQVMASMNEMMPNMMRRFPEMTEAIAAVAAQYPDNRTFSALNEEEKKRLSDLLGVSLNALEMSEPRRTGAVEPAAGS